MRRCACFGAGADRVIIEGKSNYGRPRQEYADGLATMSDEEYGKECEHAIWLSAYAANNPYSDYHWHVDVCYSEAQRRGKLTLYTRAYNAARRSAGG